jgi:hypothetical protein
MEERMINEAMEETVANEMPAIAEQVTEAAPQMASDFPLKSTKKSNTGKLILLGVGVAAILLRKPIARGIRAVVGFITGKSEEDKMRDIAKQEYEKAIADGGVPTQTDAEVVADGDTELKDK